MRNTLPLLARAVHHPPLPTSSGADTRADSPSFEIYTQTPPVHALPNPNIPAIRLVQATPSFDASLAVPDASNSTILAPKELPSPRKKLVPKKSKLALLASRATSSSSSTREKDISDVVRRVNARAPVMSEGDGTCNVTVNGGTILGFGHKKGNTHKNASSRSTIDIYVDPADDPDIGEIVVVRKKKSRAGLEGIRWALGEVTNAPEEAVPPPPSVKKKEETEKVKLKVEEKERWWSIGRGRRDSKSKDKEDKVTTGTVSKFKLRPKVPSASAVPTLSILKPTEPQQPRQRNHSLDSGLLLSVPTSNSNSTLHPQSHQQQPYPHKNPLASASTPFLTLTTSLPVPPPPQVTLTPSPAPSPISDCFSADRETQSHYSKSARQRAGSTPGLLLSPPDSGYGESFQLSRVRVDSDTGNGKEVGNGNGNGKGSIALRAMKSLARIGSWAQLRNSNNANANVGESGKEKDKFGSKRGSGGGGGGGGGVAGPGKTSSSSFEVGALSSPGRGGGGDDTTTHTHNSTGVVTMMNHPIPSQRFSTMAALGHGPPPILLNGNTNMGTQRASSGSTMGSMSLNVPGQNVRPKRLSAGSSSSGENTSSSRPGSTYTASGEDNTGTVNWNAGRKKSSVRWGGVVVGGGGEKKEKEKGKGGKMKEGREREKDGSKSKSKRTSSEGRRRTPVMSVFPQLALAIRGSKTSAEPPISTNQRGSVPTPSEGSAPVQEATAQPCRDDDEDDLDGEMDEEACVRYAVRVPTFSRHSVRAAHTKLPSKGGGLPVPAFTTAATIRAVPSLIVEDDDVPPARPRPRPMSEQLLGGTKQRPKGIVGSIGTLGEDPQALSVLEAANSDLASLINRLDLEATPDSKASRPVSYAPTDPTTTSLGALGEGTMTSSIRAMENYVRGFGRNLGTAAAEDSPLKKKLAGNPSLTSLKPGVYNKTQAQGQMVLPALPPPPMLPPVSNLIGQPIMPWAQLLEETDKAFAEEEKEKQREREQEETDVLEPLRETQVAQDSQQPLRQRRTSSTSLRTRAAPFMRTPSMSSTFGTSAVLAKVKSAAVATTPESQDATVSTAGDGKLSKYTFGVPPVRYRLPSVESLSSVVADGLGFGDNANETPTRKGHGHRRQLSHLVPVKKVKEVVKTFEARTRMEKEKEEAMIKTPTSASGRSRKRSTLDAATRKELGFKGTLGMHDDDEVESPVVTDKDDEDSDIPDELRVVLSQSDKDDTRGYPADVGAEDTLSFIPEKEKSVTTMGLAASASSTLPPSPGLPPSVPLPDPMSTPASLPTTSPALRVSPPAPTMLLLLEPSPSSSQLPTPLLTLAPSPNLAVNVPVVSLSDHDPSAEADNEHASSSDSEDTKQSFDFTGELAKLNESGGAHRRSFVEQLEEAFKTPGPTQKLGLGLGLGLGPFLTVGGKEQTGKEGMATEEVRGKPSYGRLDMAFKFGGKPQDGKKEEEDKPAGEDDSLALELPGVAALSTVDSPSHVGIVNSMGLPHQRRRSLSTSVIEEDSSVLRSIFAQAAELRSTQVQARTTKLSLESDTSSKRHARMSTVSRTSGPDARYSHARNASDISFSGMSSFGAVRTRFEFGPNTSRPSYFQTSTSHARQESLFSIASISSYGEVIKDGVHDPFNYGPPGELTMSLDEERDRVDALSSFDVRRKKRFSTDSDVSSFYFRGGHHRNQSVVSNNSVSGPPVSLYNRSFGHKRSDSAGSASSIAVAYANGGWLKQHRTDPSIDSVMSEFSVARLGRPGIGDKMFDHLVMDHAPLTSISASPPGSAAGPSNEIGQKLSYDSILDEDRRSTLDSIFDNTGQRSSMSSDSVFGYEASSVPGLYPPTLFRPLSVISMHNPGTPREDDTMITMLGGEHVRRRSIGSSFEASPCFRVEKRKHAEFIEEQQAKERARLTRQDSVASSASSTSAKLFGETRMNLARNGLLHRNSLEDSCLSAEGEDDLSIPLNASTRSSGFSRPLPSSRARPWPVVTVSHPPDTTPPLSSSEGSQSGGSQSSIDIARLKVLLQTASAGQTSSRARARARGQGHRRRPSQMSRSSIVVDTIQEENPGLSHSPSVSIDIRSNRNSFDSVASVAPESEPQIEILQWDDEKFTLGLRKYYALRSEADETIVQSQMVWPNTPFSLHALQTFTPPKHPAGMQALLEHSQKTYISLPHDWRPRRIRSRTSSINRPSPYPRTHRPSSSGGSSIKSRRSSIDGSFDRSRALQPLSPNHNNNLISPAPALATITPFSPLAFDISTNSNESVEPISVIKPAVRPRVGSAARRTALGWTKRKTPKASSKINEGKSLNANKENEAHGLLTSPPESLRIVRPRPRSRMISATPRSTSLLA